MKKTLFFAVVVSFLTMFCVTGLAQATQHPVKKGECLSSIAKQYGLNWQTVYKANEAEIKNPNRIYPGQTLEIPEKAFPFIWEKGGTNPFDGRNFIKAMEMNLFDLLPEEVKVKFTAAVEKKQSEPYRMEVGKVFAQQMYDNYKVRNNVEVQLPEDQLDAEMYAKVEFDGYIYYLIKPLICSNWSWWKEEAPKPPEPEVVAEPAPAPPEPEVVPEPEPAPPEEPMALLIPPEEIPVEEVKEEPCGEYNGHCKTDLIMGTGYYENSHSDQDADGYYYWLKVRERCFIGKVGDTDFYGGIAAFLSGGEGHDKDYNYKWNEWAAGPSLKFINGLKNYDGDIDVMYGRLYNEGGFGSTTIEQGGTGKYRSEQEDAIGIISAHLNYYARRVEGKKFLPETELNAEYRHVFKADQKHYWDNGPLAPDTSDNKMYEVTIDQAIYDFNIGDLRITPAIKAGLGKEFGLSQRNLASDGLFNFGEIGPNIKFAYKKVKSLNLGAIYKEIFSGEGDQYQIYALLDVSEYVMDFYDWLTNKKVEQPIFEKVENVNNLNEPLHNQPMSY